MGRDRHGLAGCAIFLLTALWGWKASIISHEMIYLLGSHRIADPTFLAFDFTWSTLSPTSFLFDHLLAPLWSFMGEFAIANIGRFVSWILFAWSLAAVGRSLSLPAWSLPAGFAAWMAWGQTATTCGLPLEGLQVKAFSYPLIFFSLAFAMRGRMALSGAAAGLATAFHIIVGGWGTLAIFVSLLANRRIFSPRRIATFLLASAPFVLPILLAIALFHGGGASREEQESMDRIYVRLAAPDCCDLSFFMSPRRWVRIGSVFTLTALLLVLWRERDEVRILGGFLAALAGFFLVGPVAQQLRWYSVLKLFPCQLGAALPALFLFIFAWALISKGRPRSRYHGTVAILALLGSLTLLYDRDAFSRLAAVPTDFVTELRQPRWGGPPDEMSCGDPRLYAWIRSETAKDAIFITPYLQDFWAYAERAQVASMRHPPFDRRLIEWKARLQAIHELYFGEASKEDEGDLKIEELLQIRNLYGATHYLADRRRADLEEHLLYSVRRFHVYDLSSLAASGRPLAGP